MSLLVLGIFLSDPLTSSGNDSDLDGDPEFYEALAVPAEQTIDALAKGGRGRRNVRETGLRGLSPAEIEERLKDKSLTPKEREQLVTEQKANADRNAQKRGKKGKRGKDDDKPPPSSDAPVQPPLPELIRPKRRSRD